MTSESQLTFDDVLEPETPTELYESVSVVADALVDSERRRAGDNCATVSQRHTDVDDEFVFCVQLPPRTDSFESEDVIGADEELDVWFQSSTVEVEAEPPYVVWEFVGNHPRAELVTVLIVKPLESGEDEEENSEEEFREIYDQFDFTRFVRESGD